MCWIIERRSVTKKPFSLTINEKGLLNRHLSYSYQTRARGNSNSGLTESKSTFDLKDYKLLLNIKSMIYTAYFRNTK